MLINPNSIILTNIFSRNNIEVKFPVSLEASSSPENIIEMEEQVKLKNWKKERLLEDMKREEDLLKQVKELYSKQKQELMDYITHPSLAQVYWQCSLWNLSYFWIYWQCS